MVSATEHTYRVRSRKRTKAGKVRKRRVRAKGSTPAFPVQPEGAQGPEGVQPPKNATRRPA